MAGNMVALPMSCPQHGPSFGHYFHKQLLAVWVLAVLAKFPGSPKVVVGEPPWAGRIASLLQKYEAPSVSFVNPSRLIC